MQLGFERTETGHVLIDGMIDGRDVRWVFDTGASMTVMDRSAFDRLGLDDADALHAQAAGANGMQAVSVVDVPGVQFGTRAYPPLQVAVMDLAHVTEAMGRPVDGIVGHNFLQLHDVEVDFPTASLTLRPAGTTITEHGEHLRSMAQTELGDFGPGIPRIVVTLAEGIEVPAVLDLGAAVSIVNWHAAKLVGVHPGSDRLKATPRSIKGASPVEGEVQLFDGGAPLVAGVALRGGDLGVADLPVFETLGAAAEPAMILGADQLSESRVLLDYANGVLYIEAESGA